MTYAPHLKQKFLQVRNAPLYKKGVRDFIKLEFFPKVELFSS
jgi:hypothetical protein